tara:strand:- start:1743 stop:2726 length:984 start_codon:yes stop_codon:yes gene_type:complete
MLNIFIISAEHHLLQVEQAIINFNIEEENVFYCFIRVNKSSWIERIIEHHRIINFSISDSWVFTDLLRNDNRNKLFISKLENIRSKHKVSRILISQYSSDYSLLAVNLLNAENIILMDEGTASFGVCLARLKKNNLTFFKLKVKSFFYNVNLSFPERITYFTQYNLKINENDSIEKYTFKKIPNKTNLIDGNIGLLGSSIVEVGLVSLKYYMQIINQFKILNKENDIYYYAHRKEDSDKLGEISKLGIMVVQNEMPFEFYYRNTASCPKILFSFFSPILLNLKSQFEVTPKAVIIQFNLDELKFNRQIITEIYNDYRKRKDIEFVNI